MRFLHCPLTNKDKDTRLSSNMSKTGSTPKYAGSYVMNVLRKRKKGLDQSAMMPGTFVSCRPNWAITQQRRGVSWSGGEAVRGWTELNLLNDEWRWERSQEGDALVSAAVAAAAALNDVAAVTQTASRSPQPPPPVAFAFISIAAVHLPL